VKKYGPAVLVGGAIVFGIVVAWAFASWGNRPVEIRLVDTRPVENKSQEPKPDDSRDAERTVRFNTATGRVEIVDDRHEKEWTFRVKPDIEVRIKTVWNEGIISYTIDLEASPETFAKILQIMKARAAPAILTVSLHGKNGTRLLELPTRFNWNGWARRQMAGSTSPQPGSIGVPVAFIPSLKPPGDGAISYPMSR